MGICSIVGTTDQSWTPAFAIVESGEISVRTAVAKRLAIVVVSAIGELQNYSIDVNSILEQKKKADQRTAKAN